MINQKYYDQFIQLSKIVQNNSTNENGIHELIKKNKQQ